MGRKEQITLALRQQYLAIGPAKVTRELLHWGGVSLKTITKTAPDIYLQEVRGGRLLHQYLPVVMPLGFFGPDKAVYPLVNARSLHETIVSNPGLATGYLKAYMDIHIKMWQETFGGNYDQPLSGYSNKISPTQDALLNFFHRIPWFDNCQSLTIEQDGEITQISSTIESLDWLEKTIVSAISLGRSLTHGDENHGNCLIRANNRLVMIDLGDAGFRSPFEPMAKIASWLFATQVENTSYLYRYQAMEQPLLRVHQTIDLQIAKLEQYIRAYLLENCSFLNLSPNQFNEYLDAFQMMYYLREAIFNTHRRNRSQASHSLIAKALSLSAKYL